jgi:hypothetical protein
MGFRAQHDEARPPVLVARSEGITHDEAICTTGGADERIHQARLKRPSITHG